MMGLEGLIAPGGSQVGALGGAREGLESQGGLGVGQGGLGGSQGGPWGEPRGALGGARGVPFLACF